MRKLPHILLLFLLLSACTSKSQYDAMRRGLDSLNERNRSDQPFTAADVQPYVDFFDSHGTANDQLLAYYLLGRSYHEQGEAPMALKYYQQAIECADTTDADCDFGQLSRVYGQKASLFNMQRAPRLELEAERKAVDYAWRANDTISAVLFYGYISGSYHMLNQMDSALYYSQNAVRMFNGIGRSDLAAGMLGIEIDIYLRQKNYDKAKRLLDEYETNSGFFDEEGVLSEQIESFYYYKGLYYEGICSVDSAEYYYRKLLTANSSFNSREAAYNGLLSIYRLLGNGDSIAKYSYLYCQANDSASFIHSADEITRVQALYNYSETERRAIKNEHKANKYKTIIYFILLIIVIISFIIFLFFKRQIQKQRKRYIKANRAYSSLLTQYANARSDLKLAQLDYDVYRTSKEQEIQQLQHKILSYQGNTNLYDKWDSEQAMLHSTIVTRLHKLAAKAEKASEVEWKDLNILVLDNKPEFIDKICNENLKLTEKELRVCILTRLLFIPSEIAVLLGLSKQRITNIRAFANKKLFNKEGSRNFDTNIQNL